MLRSFKMQNRKEAEGKQNKRGNRSAITQDADALYCPFEVSNPLKTRNIYSLFTESEREKRTATESDSERPGPMQLHRDSSQKTIRYSVATLQQILRNIPEQQLRDYACRRWDGLKGAPFVSDPDMRCPFRRQLRLRRNRENAERRQFNL